MAFEPGQAEQFAGADLDLDRRRVGAKRETARPEHGFPAAPVRDGRSGRRVDQVLGAGHQAHELVGRSFVAGQPAGHGGARAHHRDPVSDVCDLVHAMRDEHRAHPVCHTLPDHTEEPVARLDVERGGRFVEDQHARIPDQRARYAACLALAERQLLGRAIEIEITVQQASERLAHAASTLRGARLRSQAALHSEPHVVEDRQRADRQHLLEDRDDAPVMGRARRFERGQLLVADSEHPRIGPVHAGEDLHQGALTGPVFPDDRVHLATAQLERAVDQSPGCPECLSHVRSCERRRLRGFATPLVRAGARRLAHARSGGLRLRTFHASTCAKGWRRAGRRRSDTSRG